LKTLDKKSNLYHHCKILIKYDLLNWEKMIKGIVHFEINF